MIKCGDRVVEARFGRMLGRLVVLPVCMYIRYGQGTHMRTSSPRAAINPNFCTELYPYICIIELGFARIEVPTSLRAWIYSGRDFNWMFTRVGERRDLSPRSGPAHFWQTRLRPIRSARKYFKVLHIPCFTVLLFHSNYYYYSRTINYRTWPLFLQYFAAVLGRIPTCIGT
jgi:hypothetical protein